MDGTALTAVISATLVTAVAIGWLMAWGFSRIRFGTGGDVEGIDHLATRLQEAEEARRMAEEDLRKLRATQAARISSLEAELEATMAGLGQARREALEWRSVAEAAGVEDAWKR